MKEGKIRSLTEQRDGNTLIEVEFFPSICPGRHLSDSSLYIIVSCLLAVYDIKPPVDDEGNILKLKPKFTSGLLT